METVLADHGQLLDPYCYGQEELPTAHELRNQVAEVLRRQRRTEKDEVGHCSPETHQIPAPLFTHLAHGLAYTIGSALGYSHPSVEECLDAFLVPNKAGLTAGARAWSKHSHRSVAEPEPEPEQRTISNVANLILPSSDQGNQRDGLVDDNPHTLKMEPLNGKPLKQKKKKKLKPEEQGFWGIPSGPVSSINSHGLALFHRICDYATWRNLHKLPHHVLVYEVRVKEGYGMRWSQDWSGHRRGLQDEEIVPRDGDGSRAEEKITEDSEKGELPPPPWIFRGFIEPMMENGHELKWRHPAQISHLSSE